MNKTNKIQKVAEGWGGALTAGMIIMFLHLRISVSSWIARQMALAIGEAG
jgi:hypothetical protein